MARLFVPGTGVEPVLPQRELDFKSSASTNSAIRAMDTVR